VNTLRLSFRNTSGFISVCRNTINYIPKRGGKLFFALVLLISFQSRLNAQCPVVTPLNQTICSGGTITTISFGGNPGTWIRNNTTNVGGIEDASNGQVTSISGTLTNFTGTSQVVIFDISAPGMPSCATATVTVNPPPTVQPITPAQSSLCDGATLVLNDATPNNGTPNGGWSSSNNSIATVNSSGTVTGQSPGSVTITYTIASGGCTYSVIKSIDVQPSPTVTANATQNSICAGTSINLSATGSGTQPTTVSFNNTQQGGFQNASPLVPLFRCVNVSGIPVTALSQLTNISVTINVTHQNDDEVEVYLVRPGGSIGNVNNGTFSMTTVPGESICLTHDHGGTNPPNASNYTNTTFSSTGGTPIGSGSAPFTGTFSPDNSFATLNQTINPNGQWCLYFVDDANSGQTGVFQNFTISFTYGTSLGTYTWTASPSVPPFPFNGQNPGSVTPTSITTYTVTLTLSGCSASDPVTVTVNPLPTISGGNAVCVGQQITLNGSGTPGATPWASSNPANATVNNSGVVTGVTGGTTVNIIYTDNNGCQSPPKSITVNARPNAPTIGTTTQPTCTVATGSVVLNGLPAGNWTINPGGITGSTASTTISGLAPGTYNYTVTNANGCTSVASGNVTINPQPATPAAPTVGTITQPTCTVATGSVVLSGLPTGNWTINPGNINGNTTTRTISGLAPGTYNFTVTNAAGCTSTASVNVVINAQPATPGAPTVGTITQPTCTVATGSVVLSGLPAGNWTINPGGITGSTSSTTISGLAAGTYNYTVNNAAGCTSPASANVVINAQPATPAAPTVGTITQPTCAVATGSVV
jgi:uncharacterized protein YjdB